MKIISHVSNPNANDLYDKIAKGCVEKGHEFIYVTESSIIIKYLDSSKSTVINLRPSFKKYDRSYGKKDLEECKKIFQQSYNFTTIEYLTRADVILGNSTPEKKYSTTLAYLDAWKDILVENKPDLIATSDAIEVSNTTLSEIGKYMKIPIMFSNGGSIFSTRMFWDRTMYLNGWVEERFLKKKPGEKDLFNAEKYVKDVTTEKPMIGFTPTRPLSKKALNNTLNFFVNCILKEQQSSRYFNPVDAIKTGIKPYFRRPLSSDYYSPTEYSSKYVFYPFHVPYDAQITFRGWQYRNQDETVKLIAGALPEGFTLYAKPHPHSTGHFPLKWFKELSKVANVKLIAPEVSAHSLIEHSKAIVTVNSDVGWEALLYGKPVVTLGKPFYYGLGYTHDVEDISELSEHIKAALAQPKLTRSKIYKLVSAVHRSTVEGNFYSKGWTFNTEDENIMNIVNGILQSHKRYFKNR